MGVLTPCMPVAQFVCIASRGRKKALDPMEKAWLLATLWTGY